MYRILFFEDDAQLSILMNSYFKKRKFQVEHFKSYQDFKQSELDIQSFKPDIVLLDIKLPDVNGYQIAQQLREVGLPEWLPIIFISGLMSSEDILNAYKSGGHDYLVKPINFSELEIKIEQNINSMMARKRLQDDLRNSNDITFKVMSTMAELGSILRFHDECMLLKDDSKLIAKLFTLLASFQLKSSIILNQSPKVYKSYNGAGSHLEYKTLELLSKKSRIYSWNNRACFNYKHFSILITNMPADDEKRCGEIRDLMCFILNGLDSRFDSLCVTNREEKKSLLLSQTIRNLCALVETISEKNKELVGQFEEIIGNIERNISGDIMQFNLLENEEKTLISHINTSLIEAQAVFDKSIQLETIYQQQVSALTNSLAAAGQ